MMSTGTARLLGAALGATILEMSNVAGRVISAHALRTCEPRDLDIILGRWNSGADAAFYRGVLQHNPRLDEGVIDAALSAATQLDTRAAVTSETAPMLMHARNELYTEVYGTVYNEIYGQVYNEVYGLVVGQLQAL